MGGKIDISTAVCWSFSRRSSIGYQVSADGAAGGPMTMMVWSANLSKAAAGFGLIAVLVAHVVWVSGVYPPNNEPHIFPGLLAIVTLLVASALWRIWDATSASKRLESVQGLSLIGLGAVAFNAYFTRSPMVGAAMAMAATVLALTTLLAGARR
jgi:hypothetical protein